MNIIIKIRAKKDKKVCLEIESFAADFDFSFIFNYLFNYFCDVHNLEESAI
ncbi:hypothetical protein [Asaccharospora irregularis]|uniref:hypothetical protein n=1 Tax=Asaccharospora irregularis TaxID=29359 RepID=UPI0031D59BB8